MDIKSKAALNNGVGMPYLGLGVFKMQPGVECRNAVLWALEAGYRHVDTAMIYGNEGDVGAALRQSGVPREEVFVTTKLWNADHGFEPALKAFSQSLSRLGLDYIDLYLIHWPAEGRMESWRALEKLLDEGKCRAIGVSNYTIRHLEELLEHSSVVPAVNQVEFHPYLYQKELLGFCRKQGIQLEAYRPLVDAKRFDDPRLVEVASRYGKTPAQVLLRWTLQHDVVVIPKSKQRKHILENAGVFDFSLSKQDMGFLDAFDEGYRTGWDPTAMP